MRPLIFAATILTGLLFGDDPKPRFIPGDHQISYWRTRALMQDAVIDVMNLQLYEAAGRVQIFGGAWRGWVEAQASQAKAVQDFQAALAVAKSDCGGAVDQTALDKEKILRCPEKP